MRLYGENGPLYRGERGMTSLCTYINWCHPPKVEHIRELLKAGVPIVDTSKHGERTALLYACENPFCDVEVFETLFEYGSHPNERYRGTHWNAFYTFTRHASTIKRETKLKVVDCLIKNGVELQDARRPDDNPLLISARNFNRFPELVERYVDVGIDINVRNSGGLNIMQVIK